MIPRNARHPANVPPALPFVLPILPAALSLLFVLLPAAPASDARPGSAPAPQLGLPRTTLRLGTNSLSVQIAADDSSRETGLMSRTNLGEDEGMIFLFPTPRPVSFWMKDTLIPLSIAYVGPSGRIFEIHDMKALDETPVPSVSPAVASAIETSLGWFGRHGVLPGDMVLGIPSPAMAR